MADRSIAVRVTAIVSDFQRAMGQASGSVKGFSRDVAQMSRDYKQEMTTVGTAAAGAGLAIAAGLGMGVKAAIDWESAFAGVVKTVDASALELADLEQGLRDLAQEIPVTHQELAGIAEAAGQLGIETKNIIGFTETMAALGVATNLTSEEAATMFARFANITGLPQDKIENLGSAVVDLGNNLATTEREIGEMALRIAGAGSQIGLTEADILGFAGALSSVGIEAQAGGTAISRVFVEIDKSVRTGGEALDAFASTAGMTAEQFAEAYERDAAGAIITFIEGLGRISESGGDVFGVLEQLELQDIRVRDALLRAAGAGDLFRESIALGNEAFEENTALGKEAEQRYATVASQIQTAKNALYELGIVVGEIILPALIPLIEGARDIAKWFSDLPEPVQRAGVVLAGVSATLLTISGTALILVPRIVALVDAWRKLSAAMAASKAIGMGGAMLPTPTIGTGGLAASTAVKGAAVVGAGFAVKEAVDAGIELKNEIDSEQARLAAQLADLMNRAARGDEEAAQRVKDYRAGLIENASWWDRTVFWGTANQAEKIWEQAEQMASEGTASMEQFSTIAGHVPDYIKNWSTWVPEASREIHSYAEGLAMAAENQRILASQIAESLSPTAAAIGALQRLAEAEAAKNEIESDAEASAEEVAEAQWAYVEAVYAAQSALDSLSGEQLERTIDGISQALDISRDAARDLLEELGVLDGYEVTTVINVNTRFTETRDVQGGQGSTGRTYRGGRAAGGPMSPGGYYRVGEQGPELFEGQSGRRYMIPGEHGTMQSTRRLEQMIAAMGRGGNTYQITLQSSGNIESDIGLVSSWLAVQDRVEVRPG